MPVKKLQEYLDNHQVKYLVLSHSPAYTSQEIAESAHVSGKELAKVVFLKVDGILIMAVILANQQVNINKVKESLNAKEIALANESEFKNKFPGCELGAIPPFGNLYDIPVYVGSDVLKQDHLIFNAGSLTQLLQVNTKDYERLVKPKVITLT